MAENSPTKIEMFKAVTDGLFRKLLAVLIVFFSGNFLFTMAKAEGSQVGELIIGYVFGVITTIIAFYYGTSQSSQDKEKRLSAPGGNE